MGRVYWSKYDVKEEMESLRKNFVESSVKMSLDHAKEMVETAAMYLEACEAQMERIKNTVYRPTVYLHREKPYGAGKIKYYIGVHWTPQITDLVTGTNEYRYGRATYTPTTDCELLEGGDKKKEAVEKVKALAEKYGAEIETKGFEDVYWKADRVKNPITGADRKNEPDGHMKEAA